MNFTTYYTDWHGMKPADRGTARYTTQFQGEPRVFNYREYDQSPPSPSSRKLLNCNLLFSSFGGPAGGWRVFVLPGRLELRLGLGRWRGAARPRRKPG